VESNPGTSAYAAIVSKWATGKLSFWLGINNATFNLLWGYSGGASQYSYALNASTAGRWYHFTVILDGVGKTYTVYVWDDTAQTTTTYSGSPGNEINVEDAEFCIGCQDGGANYFDGIIDEVVVFDRLLSSAEANAIRTGTYDEQIRHLKFLFSRI